MSNPPTHRRMMELRRKVSLAKKNHLMGIDDKEWVMLFFRRMESSFDALMA